jgi:hypothetical protein
MHLIEECEEKITAHRSSRYWVIKGHFTSGEFNLGEFTLCHKGEQVKFPRSKDALTALLLLTETYYAKTSRYSIIKYIYNTEMYLVTGMRFMPTKDIQLPINSCITAISIIAENTLLEDLMYQDIAYNLQRISKNTIKVIPHSITSRRC